MHCFRCVQQVTGPKLTWQHRQKLGRCAKNKCFYEKKLLYMETLKLLQKLYLNGNFFKLLYLSVSFENYYTWAFHSKIIIPEPDFYARISLWTLQFSKKRCISTRNKKNDRKRIWHKSLQLIKLHKQLEEKLELITSEIYR